MNFDDSNKSNFFQGKLFLPLNISINNDKVLLKCSLPVKNFSFALKNNCFVLSKNQTVVVVKQEIELPGLMGT